MLGVGVLAFGLTLSSGAVSAQSAPGERFAAAVEMFNRKQLVEARDALTAILTDYDTPENRANEDVDVTYSDTDQYEFKLKWDLVDVSGAPV